MKTRPTKPSCFPITLVALLLLAFEILAQSATITWTNTAGGNWSVSSNWSPNQVPTNTDNVRITAPGTYTVVLDIGGAGFSFSVQPLSLIVGAGGGASGVQTFAMTNHALIAGSIVVTNGGVFNVAGDSFYLGSNMVVNGGIFNPTVSSSFSGGGSLILNPLIVTNGGTVNASGHTLYLSTFGGAVTVANGGRLRTSSVGIGPSFTVASGGVVDAIAELYISNPLMNSGTLNLTNTTVYIYNDTVNGTGGGIVNQAGGVINLRSNTAISSGTGPTAHGYFLNSGTVTAGDTPGSTISVKDLNNTLGTVTNLSGTLMLGLYQTNLSGKYGAAAGATIQLIGANNPVPLTPGTPLALSGNGNFQFTSGYLRLPTDSIPKLALQGTKLELGPAFQGGAITNLALDGIALSNTLPVTGSFIVKRGTVTGSFPVNNGGELAVSNAIFTGLVPINSGGRLNLAGPLTLGGPFTNAGAINLTNFSLSINSTGAVNQAGGLINFRGDGDINLTGGSSNYFINRGTLLKSAAAGTTSSIVVMNFDSSQGTVTNLAGTLDLKTFQGTLAGIFHTSPGALTRITANTNAVPLVLGSPLIFAGGGQNLFLNGFLSLPTNVIPGLTLFGGRLQLGASFQGGAITNLTLANVAVSNTLPITGNLTASNGTISGKFIVANDGVLDVNNLTLDASLTVANGGLFRISNPNAFVDFRTNQWLTISSGGRLDISSVLLIAGPLTNAGTINLTNSPLVLDNDGGNYRGGLINQPGGVMDFWGDAGVFTSSGQEYLINQGHLTKHGGNGYTWFDPPFTTNSGVITAETGRIGLGYFSAPTLLPSGSLGVRLNSATDYGNFEINADQILGGSFNVTLNGGYIPAGGSSFIVLSYDSHANNFTSINLPSPVMWQTTLGSTNLVLLVTGGGSGQPQFIPLTLAGTNLIFNGTGGSPGSNYIVLVSTNVSLPLASWSAVATNNFDGSGNFKYTNSVTPAKPRQFFILKLL